jgi:hypothetical protein
MMTAAVNVFDFRNLSLVCRNGTEAVGRLSKSPYLTTTGPTTSTVPTELRKPFGAPRAVTPTRPTQLFSPIIRSKKRARTGVRFAPDTIDRNLEESEPDKPRAKKRRRFEPSDSDKWYTKGELRGFQKSCVSALKSHIRNPVQLSAVEDKDDIGLLLNRFSPENQTRRRIARFQMYETIRAVQAFEKATKTKAPPELLSHLLHRFSTSRAIEANQTALRMAQTCTK